jgi:hypothetical protein
MYAGVCKFSCGARSNVAVTYMMTMCAAAAAVVVIQCMAVVAAPAVVALQCLAFDVVAVWSTLHAYLPRAVLEICAGSFRAAIGVAFAAASCSLTCSIYTATL